MWEFIQDRTTALCASGALVSRVVSIVNQKGGVGKTTTAVNLAAGLALAERTTLLVDMDPQANATMSLGIRPEELDLAVYDVLKDPDVVREAIRPSGIANLKILPSNADLVAAEIELVEDGNRVSRLERALSKVKGEFAYVIVDCPPSLGILTVNSICASDSLLIPMQCEYFSLEGLSRTLEAVRVLRERTGRRLEIAGLLLTMTDTRTKLSSEVASEVRRHFDSSVFSTVIPRNIRVAEAPGHGKPVLHYDINSRGSKAFLSLTEEFLTGEREK